MISNSLTAQAPVGVNTFERRVITVALFLYPVLLLTLHGGMNWMFGILLIVALIHLVRTRHQLADTFDLPNLGILAFALASPLIAILLSQIAHTDFKSHAYDGASRLLLALPILLVLRKVDIKYLGVIQYAFPLGSIGALIAVLLFPLNQYQAGSVTTSFLNHIHLGDLALMLGVLSVLSIHWVTKDSLLLILLKVFGLVAGLYVSSQTGARGGWVALPLFLAIWFYFRGSSKPWLKISLALSLSLLIGLASYFAFHGIRYRIDLIYSDLLAYNQGNLDTSIGIRLQLWKAAIHLFWENPLFGIGADGFKPATQALAASGYLTPTAGEFGGAEVHNEILAQMVRFGIFGLLSILAVYLVPLLYLWRLAKSNLQPQRTAAIMGMILILGFFTFGLTVEIFNLKMTIAFFSLTLAVLFAAASNKSKQ
jgi:O-antigen ligase